MTSKEATNKEHQQAETVDYKKKYQTMKKKLRMLVYEQECFVDELKKSQRKLLKVSRDKSFLLDRLLQYEKVAEMSSDSESTESSDSGNEAVKEAGSAKKKKIPGSVNSTPAGQPSGSNSQMSMMLGGGMLGSYLMGQTPRTSEPAKKKPKIVKKVTPKTASRIPNVTKTLADTKFPTNSTSEGHLSREEVERHLEMKHSIKPHFMSLDMASHNLPDDIFSHDSSNQECSIQHEDDQELIIDMAH